ncbi:MAG: PH domain-containing protein, partial [Pseudolysinimonas sp.]
ASGTQQQKAAAGAVPAGAAAVPSLVGQRVNELIAPELDPSLAEPASVVTMHPARLIGSTVLSSATLMFVLVVAGGIVAAIVSHEFFVIFGAVPLLFGLGSFLVNRIVKSLRYTIAGTPDGVRVGYGLLSTSNETLPPGRIHSISISQQLLWRPADWWEVKVNRAGKSSSQGAAGQQNTTILPVGTRAEVFKVLELVMPGIDAETRAIVEAGLAKATEGDGFTNSPRRAAILRWFSWRRNGFALRPDAAILRRGAIWRELVVVPAARMQSVAVHQGPLERAMRLANVQAHTVAGPINARLGALDVEDASRFFRDLAETAVAAAAADRSHRWRSGA